MRLAAHLSRWLESEGLDAAALTPIVVETFMAARRAAGYVDFGSSRALGPLLGYLRELGTAPHGPPVVAITPEEVLLERYRRYLTMERGLVASTARYYIHLVRPFLAGRATAGGIDLEHLAAGDVTAFVLAECPRRSVPSAKNLVTALRSLLAFLSAGRGRCSSGQEVVAFGVDGGSQTDCGTRSHLPPTRDYRRLACAGVQLDTSLSRLCPMVNRWLSPHGTLGG